MGKTIKESGDSPALPRELSRAKRPRSAPNTNTGTPRLYGACAARIRWARHSVFLSGRWRK